LALSASYLLTPADALRKPTLASPVAQATTHARTRLQSIEVLRGLVIGLMVLDHVRAIHQRALDPLVREGEEASERLVALLISEIHARGLACTRHTASCVGSRPRPFCSQSLTASAGSCFGGMTTSALESRNVAHVAANLIHEELEHVPHSLPGESRR
jgi:hypothetical protein